MTIRRARLYQAILGVSKKAMAIQVRWAVVIICSYLLLFSEAASSFQLKIHGLVLLYILSNIELYFLDEKLFGLEAEVNKIEFNHNKKLDNKS